MVYILHVPDPTDLEVEEDVTSTVTSGATTTRSMMRRPALAVISVAMAAEYMLWFPYA